MTGTMHELRWDPSGLSRKKAPSAKTLLRFNPDCVCCRQSCDISVHARRFAGLARLWPQGPYPERGAPFAGPK